PVAALELVALEAEPERLLERDERVDRLSAAERLGHGVRLPVRAHLRELRRTSRETLERIGQRLDLLGARVLVVGGRPGSVCAAAVLLVSIRARVRAPAQARGIAA